MTIRAECPRCGFFHAVNVKTNPMRMWPHGWCTNVLAPSLPAMESDAVRHARLDEIEREIDGLTKDPASPSPTRIFEPDSFRLAPTLLLIFGATFALGFIAAFVVAVAT